MKERKQTIVASLWSKSFIAIALNLAYSKHKCLRVYQMCHRIAAKIWKYSVVADNEAKHIHIDDSMM